MILHGANLRCAALVALRKQCPSETSRTPPVPFSAGQVVRCFTLAFYYWLEWKLIRRITGAWMHSSTVLPCGQNRIANTKQPVVIPMKATMKHMP